MNRSNSRDTCEKETTTINGLAKIMRLAFHGDDLSNITSQLATRISFDSLDAAAMMDLSIVFQLNAKPNEAIELQSEALLQCQYYELKSNPKNPALRLLAIMAPGEVMANTPLDFLVENSNIALSFLYVGEGLPVPSKIPDHDIAFVAVCESDRSQFLLTHLSKIMEHWPRPFINEPSRIALLSRNLVTERLSSTDGIATSDARRLSRADLINAATTGAICVPVIARPVDSHAGQGLSKLENRMQILEYLETQESDEFYVAPFIDYRSLDGMYRKYRIVIIDGKPFAAHMAISQHWMVHYLNADMMLNEKNRNTEAGFMLDFDMEFAIKHRTALHEINNRIGLDYYSIDCAETLDGKLIVFELDSGAVVHSMDSIELFPYKAPQMQLVFAAFQQMLRRRAEGSHDRIAA